MAWGGTFANLAQSAWDIVTTFVQRIGDWIKDQLSSGDDLTDEDIQEEVETLAGHVGDFEVAAAIEHEVLQSLTFAGVRMVKSMAQPGACEPCLDRAEQGAVPIDEFDPPPYHGGCRCSTTEADEQ